MAAGYNGVYEEERGKSEAWGWCSSCAVVCRSRRWVDGVGIGVEGL